MADSAELHVTDEEMVKANNELEEAGHLFPDVNITVDESKITFTGEVYEHIIRCKKWFQVRIGQERRRTRRFPKSDIYSTIKKCDKYKKYVTYEKINVIVVKADLLKFDGKVDCFVNTTNNKLDEFSRISKLIKQTGGRAYETACEEARQEASKLKTTQCLTTGAGDMSTKHIIHAFCPAQIDYSFTSSKKEMENDIFSTVFNCLKMAEEMHFQTIAFTFLSTGHGQLDIRVCSEQYAYAVLEFSRQKKNQFVVEDIYFIDNDDNKVDRVNEVFGQILPSTEMQLLEVARRDYSNYSVARSPDLTSELEQHLLKEDVSIRNSDEVGGQIILEEGRHDNSKDDCSLEREHTYDEGKPDDFRHVREDTNATDRYLENDGYECPVNNINNIDDLGANSKDVSSEVHHYECINEEVIYEKEKMSVSRRKIGTYELVIERLDIRSSNAIAIICPENDEAERGGLLAASIKCTFRQSFDPKKLSKLQKNAIATTECKTENGNAQYILHVRTPVWKAGIPEKELEKGLKEAIERLFDKLKRHKKRNIRTIAIPLLGIDSVENDGIVGKCCKWQIEKTVQILQRSEQVVNLQEVHLTNRCERITNTLITELKVALSR